MHFLMPLELTIGGRHICFSEVPSKTFAFISFLPSVISTVKNPLRAIRYYFRRCSPAFLELRSGHTLGFSPHPHDIVTFFEVFIKKIYGNVSKGATIFDVGANIGIFSLYAAISGAKKVYAIEPSKEAYDVLCHNVRRNNLTNIVEPINMLVSGQDGQSVRFPYHSSPYNTVLDSDRKATRFCEVETITVASLLTRSQEAHVDLLKLDCEGCEKAVLCATDGSFMEKVTEIRVEIHGEEEKVISHLKNNGYFVKARREGVMWFKRK